MLQNYADLVIFQITALNEFVKVTAKYWSQKIPETTYKKRKLTRRILLPATVMQYSTAGGFVSRNHHSVLQNECVYRERLVQKRLHIARYSMLFSFIFRDIKYLNSTALNSEFAASFTNMHMEETS